MPDIFEMRKAVFEAESTLKNADKVAEDMARILIGRLRSVNSWGILASLKKELRDYNMRTNTWKEREGKAR